jgi:signal transduction histidine kinase
LQLNLASGLPPVIADVAQMQQIVMNLVINAAEAIGDGPGVVAITTCVQDVDGEFNQIAPGKYISLEVQDTGEGMDEATMGKIFDPFFSTKFTGRGLGLSATQGIVRGHKGLIRVESRQGAGSTFQVLLPAAVEQTVEAREGAPDDFRGSGAVRVVDAEEVVRGAAAALEPRGHPAIVASAGQAARDLFRKVST